MCDFDGLRDFGLCITLNGDVQPLPRRGDFQAVRAHLHQIERAPLRRRLPVGYGRVVPDFLRDFLGVYILGHEMNTAIHVPENDRFARMGMTRPNPTRRPCAPAAKLFGPMFGL